VNRFHRQNPQFARKPSPDLTSKDPKSSRPKGPTRRSPRGSAKGKEEPPLPEQQILVLERLRMDDPHEGSALHEGPHHIQYAQAPQWTEGLEQTTSFPDQSEDLTVFEDAVSSDDERPELQPVHLSRLQLSGGPAESSVSGRRSATLETYKISRRIGDEDRPEHITKRARRNKITWGQQKKLDKRSETAEPREIKRMLKVMQITTEARTDEDKEWVKDIAERMSLLGQDGTQEFHRILIIDAIMEQLETWNPSKEKWLKKVRTQYDEETRTELLDSVRESSMDYHLYQKDQELWEEKGYGKDDPMERHTQTLGVIRAEANVQSALETKRSHLRLNPTQRAQLPVARSTLHSTLASPQREQGVGMITPVANNFEDRASRYLLEAEGTFSIISLENRNELTDTK